MKRILLFIITFLFIFNSIWVTFSAIDLTVSPIIYEIEAKPWDSIIKTATLFNNTDKTFTIYTSKSDFEANWTNWNPKFIRKSELVNPSQELSTRINLSVASFNIWPNENKEITFTINVPSNATPGWHYWAVFFKNNNSESSSWNNIAINVDYWVLILVNIAWEIIIDWDVWDVTIWWGGWWWWYSNIKEDECPYWDFTKSKYDKKCVDDFFEDMFNSAPEQDPNDIKDNENEDDEFHIDFNIPFENKWNTHIKPEWKIILKDENWNEIKWIWKEIIKDKDWNVIWEKIVDYIPINDIWWNVLPNTKRDFDTTWKWFPYKSYDDNWNEIIKYWTPEEYYSRKNVNKETILMPWERVNEKICERKITAVTEIKYKDINWEDVTFNSAKDFTVNYKEKYIWLNPYFFACAWIIFFFFFIFWLIFRKKKKKCIECKKKIDKDMKICPYCWRDQQKKPRPRKNKEEIIEETKDEEIKTEEVKEKLKKEKKSVKKKKKE